MSDFSLWHRIRRWIACRIYPEIFEWYYGDELSNLGTIADALENRLTEKQMEVDYLRAQEEIIKDRLSHRDGLLKLCNAEKLLLAQSAAAWREKYYALEPPDEDGPIYCECGNTLLYSEGQECPLCGDFWLAEE